MQDMDSGPIHVDTMALFSIALGYIVLVVCFRKASKEKYQTDTPSGLQILVELMVEFVDNSFKGKNLSWLE